MFCVVSGCGAGHSVGRGGHPVAFGLRPFGGRRAAVVAGLLPVGMGVLSRQRQLGFGDRAGVSTLPGIGFIALIGVVVSLISDQVTPVSDPVTPVPVLITQIRQVITLAASQVAFLAGLVSFVSTTIAIVTIVTGQASYFFHDIPTWVDQPMPI